jgi:hypothetical protein
MRTVQLNVSSFGKQLYVVLLPDENKAKSRQLYPAKIMRMTIVAPKAAVFCNCYSRGDPFW